MARTDASSSRGSTAEEPRRRGARRELRSACALVMARLAGGLRGCFVYCSLSGGSLLLHPSSLPAPSRTIMCFLLAWMSRLGGLVGTNASMRRCCCSRRRGQASKCRCSPSFSAPCSSLWVAGVLGLDFRADPEIHRWIRPASLKQLTVSRTVSFWWIAPSMPLCNTARHVPGCSAHQGQRRRWKGRKG